MGTRSLTKIISTYGDEEMIITTMYRQMDGYPEGHGLMLAEFLKPFTVVNGINLAETRKIANGLPCLAAQMYAYFKEGAGGIYCYHPEATDCGEAYVYEIRLLHQTLESDVVGGEINLRCIDPYEEKELFNGTPKEFINQYDKSISNA